MLGDRAITQISEGVQRIKIELCSTSLIPFRLLQDVIEAMDPEVHDALAWHADFEEQWQTQVRETHHMAKSWNLKHYGIICQPLVFGHKHRGIHSCSVGNGL